MIHVIYIMMKNIKHIIYKTTNIKTGKFYIGKHSTDNLEDGYLGSGIALNDSIKKYGIENFKREIIEFCQDPEHLSEREKYWIVSENSIIPNGYNISLGGKGGDNFTHNPNKDVIREKMSINRKPRKATPEERERRSRMMIGKKLKSHKKIQCEFCLREINKANYSRWHGRKCKSNPNADAIEFKKKYCDFCSIETNPTNYSMNHGIYCSMNPNRVERKITKILCKHCNNDFSEPNYKVFHGENCKMNPIFLSKPDEYKKTKAYFLSEKISKVNKGKNISDEMKKAISLKNKGKKVSQETKNKMSISGRKRWANLQESTNGYECEYCKTKIRLKTNYIRWHGENCKNKG
jgi:group I intron endonuclease